MSLALFFTRIGVQLMNALICSFRYYFDSWPCVFNDHTVSICQMHFVEWSGRIGDGIEVVLPKISTWDHGRTYLVYANSNASRSIQSWWSWRCAQTTREMCDVCRMSLECEDAISDRTSCLWSLSRILEEEAPIIWFMASPPWRANIWVTHDKCRWWSCSLRCTTITSLMCRPLPKAPSPSSCSSFELWQGSCSYNIWSSASSLSATPRPLPLHSPERRTWSQMVSLNMDFGESVTRSVLASAPRMHTPLLCRLWSLCPCKEEWLGAWRLLESHVWICSRSQHAWESSVILIMWFGEECFGWPLSWPYPPLVICLRRDARALLPLTP